MLFECKMMKLLKNYFRETNIAQEFNVVQKEQTVNGDAKLLNLLTGQPK